MIINIEMTDVNNSQNIHQPIPTPNTERLRQAPKKINQFLKQTFKIVEVS